MLAGAAQREPDVDPRCDRASGEADLMLLREPAGVRHLPCGGDTRAEAPGERENRRQRGRAADPASDAEDERRGVERRGKPLGQRTFLLHAHARGRHAHRQTLHARDAGAIRARGMQNPRPDRRHLGPRVRQDRRDDGAAERRLHLPHAPLAVDVEIDRVAGEPQPEPGRDARREVAAADAGRQQH